MNSSVVPKIYSVPGISDTHACFMIQSESKVSAQFNVQFHNVNAEGEYSDPLFVDFKKLWIAEGNSKYCVELKEHNTATLTVMESAEASSISMHSYLGSFESHVTSNGEIEICGTMHAQNTTPERGDIGIDNEVGTATVQPGTVFHYCKRPDLSKPSMTVKLGYEAVLDPTFHFAHAKTATFPTAALSIDTVQILPKPVWMDAEAEERM